MLNKFKVGQRVRVVKKIDSWLLDGVRTRWDGFMDNTIGRIYTIIGISVSKSSPNLGYILNTAQDLKHLYGNEWNSYYPEERWNFNYLPESLELEIAVGQQLEFDFMKG